MLKKFLVMASAVAVAAISNGICSMEESHSTYSQNLLPGTMPSMSQISIFRTITGSPKIAFSGSNEIFSMAPGKTLKDVSVEDLLQKNELVPYQPSVRYLPTQSIMFFPIFYSLVQPTMPPPHSEGEATAVAAASSQEIDPRLTQLISNMDAGAGMYGLSPELDMFTGEGTANAAYFNREFAPLKESILDIVRTSPSARDMLVEKLETEVQVANLALEATSMEYEGQVDVITNRKTYFTYVISQLQSFIDEIKTQ